MAAPKGHPKYGTGRQKGTPNKDTAMLRDMILKALDKVGGVRYLTEQAKANPAAFMSLLAKVLPTQVSGEDGGPMVVQIVKFCADDP